MSIQVQQLTKVFGSQKAVNNVTFSAQPGEILGFLGPNGAGKSTTMKIATCYLPPTSGQVTVAGYDVEKDSLEVRRRVGYLPEHNPLYLEMYVREYLHFIGKLHGLKGNALQKRIGEMIEMVGLTREQTKVIGMLSKGYRQRVGLAQALIHDPEVLILDEPTTGLDPNQLAEIRGVIQQISQNKTVILSTHIMQEVQALCHRVVIINLGQIVADSPIEEMKNFKQTVEIGLELEEVPADWSVFLEIPGVTEVRPISPRQCTLVAHTTEDIRGAIFRKAVASNLVIVGMNKESISLENVFRELTTGQATGA